MRPLDEFPIEARRDIRGVLADIDDTLTTEGKLTAQAYSAMERLHQAGLIVIPITGRPAGWCDHIARMWPVDGVVGENGAFYFRRAAGKMARRYMLSAEQRAADRHRLAAIRDRILAEVPGCATAADQHYREADLAIDYCEDVSRLSDAAIDRIVELMQDAGLTAKVSSIHINGWFGNHDKLSMTRIMLAECFGIDLDAQKQRFVFVGDSPNDEPMFRFFPNAAGVANIRDFEARIGAKPAFVTQARCGAGFAEVAEALIMGRNQRRYETPKD